ncbi:MFS transporter [Dongia deserti]|uniref:MFS transporter n=1 Tax=Dongia deserti TaxID=2268030 RepID=UPI000E64991C|nr:MFS transporter [Dongia deserti]
MMRGRGWGPDLAALRHRDFAFYVSANFLTTIALQVQATALAWQIYAITEDPFQLGLVGLAEFLPAALLALPAGHLADRIDRRLLILIGVTAELVAALTLVGLAATDQITELAILSIALCFGVARAIAIPAARALMPSLVPKKDLTSAVAWSSTSWQVATIAGPGLGGLLYSGLGGWLYPETPAVAYGGAALGFAGAVFLFFRMRGRPVVSAPAHEGDFAAILAGLVLIFRNRLLLSTISLDLFAVLFSGATALIPVFAQDILDVDAGAGGLLRSAQGFGATATALLLTQFPLQRHVGRRLFMAVGLFGLAAIVFGLSRDYWLSFAALLVLGAADMVSVYIRATLVPLATPDELRGRVTAVESVFIGASNELGMFVAGTGGALLGPVAAVLVGGSMTLLVTLSWAGLFPTLRRLDRFTELT